jgi:hypothetical protein
MGNSTPPVDDFGTFLTREFSDYALFEDIGKVVARIQM